MVGKKKTMLKKRVLVIAVHPDDETLGCGGTILAHQAAGHEVYCVFCTAMSSENGFSPETIDKRAEEVAAVSALYGFKETFELGLDALRVDEYSFTELVAKLSSVFKSVEPRTVYLPFCYDVHSDHRKLFEAAYSCTKNFRYPSVKNVLMMETLSETEFALSKPDTSFVPNSYVDISPYIDKKLEAMNIFESEIGEFPFPRSEEAIVALAKYRGSTAGVKYAESFMLLKHVMGSEDL
jgi:LmbE family N-acetylglucosaminyl deacetylase